MDRWVDRKDGWVAMNELMVMSISTWNWLILLRM